MTSTADQLAGALVAQAGAMVQAAELYQVRAYLGRLEKNLQAIGASGSYVVMAGGDLYQLAAASYGDATAWAQIARVNGLTDPVIDGLMTVLVPPTPGGTGGVLSELLPAELLGTPPSIFAETPGPRDGVGDLDFELPENAIFTGAL